MSAAQMMFTGRLVFLDKQSAFSLNKASNGTVVNSDYSNTNATQDEQVSAPAIQRTTAVST